MLAKQNGECKEKILAFGAKRGSHPGGLMGRVEIGDGGRAPDRLSHFMFGIEFEKDHQEKGDTDRDEDDAQAFTPMVQKRSSAAPSGSAASEMRGTEDTENTEVKKREDEENGPRRNGPQSPPAQITGP